MRIQNLDRAWVMFARKHILRVVWLICLMHGAEVLAAPDEIIVYTDEMNEPGRFGLEQHLNYSLAGAQSPEYAGQMTPHHVLQATPEFSYGITHDLEAGMYVPVAVAPDGNSFFNGLRLRLKYIAPRPDEVRWFYGLNAEVGYSSVRISESSLGLELRPIVGYRDALWLLGFNPILNTGLSDNVARQAQFRPALKLSRRMVEGVHGGIEYYGAYGVVDKMLPADQVGHTIYAVLDTEIRGFEVNFGLGYGNSNTSDTWVAKGVIAFPL